MAYSEVMNELASLANDRVKKRYLGLGVREPLFGVATGTMKPLAKRYMYDQPLAEQLYASGNFDAMYLAGVIANPQVMTPADIDRWMEHAYSPVIADFIVSVTLSETAFAQETAWRYVHSDQEIFVAAGWNCNEWLLGSRNDAEFDPAQIGALLARVEQQIHAQSDTVKKAMNRFLIAAGVSYLPLHAEAIDTAERIGNVTVTNGNKQVALTNAVTVIRKEAERNRIGFKRKAVRC